MQTFIQNSQLKFPTQFDYSSLNLINTRKIVTIKCIRHNCVFNVTPFAHLHEKYKLTGGCPECINELKIHQKLIDKTAEFITRSNIKYGENKYDYSKVNYQSQMSPVMLKCLKHELWFTIQPKTHLRNACHTGGCPTCAEEISRTASQKPKKSKKRELEPEIQLNDGNNVPKKIKIECKAKIWKKKEGFVTCSIVTENTFCRFHNDYLQEWLNESQDIYTICKRCNKGFEKNGNVRCQSCNDNSNQKKEKACKFIKKNGDQCTNQRKKKCEYCGTHFPYAKKGVTPENRCQDCGNPKERNDLTKCNNCHENRLEKAKDKYKIMKEIKLNTPFKPLVEGEWEISPYYVSGFFDGDGSICIDKNLCLQVSFSQCAPEILLKLQGIFGGIIYKCDMSHKPNQRDQHNLRICGRECEKVLVYLDKGSIMKWDQIQVAKIFIRMNNLQDLTEEKTQLKDQMTALNKSYKKTHDKRYGILNWEYIAGIFDAEGCIETYKKKTKKGYSYGMSYIKITQKNDYRLLEEIKSFIGHGRVEGKILWKTERIDFVKWDLQKILPLLIVKRKQSEWLLEFFETEDNTLRMELHEKIKGDKHN
jgi:hypothetical protein